MEKWELWCDDSLNHFLSVHQKHQRLMIISGYNMILVMDGYQNDSTLTLILYKQCKNARAPHFWYVPHFCCTQGKHHFPYLPWSLPLTLVLASLLSPVYSKISSPIDKHLILVVLPSSLPLPLTPSSHKSTLGRLQMLSRSPGTLTPSSATQSPPR